MSYALTNPTGLTTETPDRLTKLGQDEDGYMVVSKRRVYIQHVLTRDDIPHRHVLDYIDSVKEKLQFGFVLCETLCHELCVVKLITDMY